MVEHVRAQAPGAPAASVAGQPSVLFIVTQLGRKNKEMATPVPRPQSGDRIQGPQRELSLEEEAMSERTGRYTGKVAEMLHELLSG